MQSAAILLEDKTKQNQLAHGRSKGLQKKKKAFAGMRYRSPLSAAAAGCPPQSQVQLPEGSGGFEFSTDGSSSLMRSPLNTVGGVTLLMGNLEMQITIPVFVSIVY